MKYVWVTVLAAAIMFIAGPAYAHPRPTDYSPGDGTTVTAPPGEVWVEFDETISEGTLEVYDPCGQRVDDGSADVLLTRVTVGVSADKAGMYKAVWIVIGDDGHKVSGDWNFTVTNGETCPGAEPEDPQDGSKGNDDSSNDDDDTNVSATGGSDDDNDDDTAVATGGKNKDDRNKGKGNKHANHGTKKGVDEPLVDDGGTTGTDAAAAAPASGDIPLDWLMISFGIAALIGASAGQIYVNLVGPQTPTKPRRNT